MSYKRPVPNTVWSFDPNRVPEHPDIVLGAYISEPFLGLGQDDVLPAPVRVIAVLTIGAILAAVLMTPRRAPR